MYSNRRKPLPSTTSSFTSFSSDNSYIPTYRRSPPVVLRQLATRDLDEIDSANWNRSLSRQRESSRIPRPILRIPRPTINIPRDNSIWTVDERPTHVEEISLLPNSVLRTNTSERPFYQLAPPSFLPQIPTPPSSPPPPPIQYRLAPIRSQRFSPTPTPPPPPPPIQYRVAPIRSQRFSPIRIFRRPRENKYVKEKTPGLCTTLCSGGFASVVVLIYLVFILALPIAKLVVGIIHVKECPVNKNIPLYMIVSGASGLAIILFLLLSSTCTFYRSSTTARKSTHKFIICTIALARGMQGVLAIFLIVWFFIGNFWVFGSHPRVRTDKPSDVNYCHPGLYWFAFYILIFTYVYALFMCFMKFCTNFLCCGALDIWKRAFS